MQFGGATHHAALDVSHDDGAIIGALASIAFDEAVTNESVEAIVTALAIEPQEMIAQQRQFFLLTQRANGAFGWHRTGRFLVVHFITPLGSPSRRRRIPSP